MEASRFAAIVCRAGVIAVVVCVTSLSCVRRNEVRVEEQECIGF